MKISGVIIAFNEERNIAAAIESVSWTDEILVIDAESSDETVQTATNLGAKVLVRKWTGFASQKQFGIDQAENDWILSLDADERVSSELRDEILALKTIKPMFDGYKIPRLSFYMNKAIRHGGWYPDRQLRFFDRRKGHWKDVPVHESFKLNRGTRCDDLKGNLLHYSVESSAHHHRMIGERYAPLAAEQMFEEGRLTSPLKLALAGPSAFFRAFFLKAGFLDGLPGFVIAKFAAHHAFLKHAMLLELQRGTKTEN